MKSIITLGVFTFCFAFFIPASAQVKIGNNPANINANALLELESDSKGLLFPRLNTSNIDAMINPPDGMMVYNTTTSLFQIRTGGVWRSLNTENSTGWSLYGNAGINYSTNFIGTTDNKSFRVRTDNLQRFIVDSIGRITVGADSSNVSGYTDGLLHVNNATAVNTFLLSNTSTNTTQFGVRSFVKGIAAGSSRTAGEFQATGSGTNNIGITSVASGATNNTAGSFTALGGASSSNAALRALATGPFGSANYAVFASSNHWAAYFVGNSYFSNRVILGSSVLPDNAQLTVRGADTTENAIYATSANTDGNGLVVTYTNSPTFYFAVYAQAPASGSNAAGYFQGNVTVTGTFSNPSDERLKRNIQPLTNALNKVMKIGTHSYIFKSEFAEMNLPKGNQFGYLAQDIEGIFPELVVNSVDKSKGMKNLFYYKSVNYIGMIPVLTKALQEEHEQLLQTEAQIDTLKADNEALKKRLDAIEKALKE